jgi:hypothetical protein
METDLLVVRIIRLPVKLRVTIAQRQKVSATFRDFYCAELEAVFSGMQWSGILLEIGAGLFI